MGYVLALWGEFVKFTGGRAGLVHLLLFAAALVCCFFLGKEERHRLFWPSVLVGIFFFNPVFYKYVGTRFLSGVYWRLLWMLPWTFVIAYAVVRMAYRLGKQALRIVVVAVACVCIFVTGKPVLSAETYGERSNVYELPQAAVEIADLVQSRLVDWQETLIVPNELLCSDQTIFRSRMSAVRKKCGGLYLQHRGGRTAGLRGNEQRASGCGACHGDCEK